MTKACAQSVVLSLGEGGGFVEQDVHSSVFVGGGEVGVGGSLQQGGGPVIVRVVVLVTVRWVSRDWACVDVDVEIEVGDTNDMFDRDDDDDGDGR